MVTTSHHTKQSYSTRSGSSRLWLAVSLLLIPIALFWYVWDIYAVNVPKWDDHVLKALFFYLDQESSFSGKAYQFFRQHNEHRIVYDRLVSWLDFHLFGKLSFRHLMVVGNLSLLGLLAIFGLTLGRSVQAQSSPLKSRLSPTLTDCLYYLPPVAFLLLNLSQWENMFWGMASLQNFTVIVWIVWAIYLLAFTRNVGAPILMAVLATLTSGNGLLVWPVGVAMLLLRVILQEKDSRTKLLRWSCAAIAAIILYFWGYEKPAGNPATVVSLVELLTGWLAFAGSAAETIPTGPVLANCVLLGGLTLTGVLLISLFILKRWIRSGTLTSADFFFIGAALFLVGTSVVVAWTRTGFGINTLITSRYKLYSLLLLAIIYTYFMGQMRASFREWGLRIGLLFSVAMLAFSYRSYLNETIQLRQYLLTDQQFNWSYSTNQAILTLDTNTARLMNNAPAFYDRALPTFYQPANGTSVPFTSVQKNGTNFVIIDTMATTSVGPDAGTYVLMRSGKRVYLFQTIPVKNTTWKAKVGLASLFRQGFSASIIENALEPATYQLERLTVNPNNEIERFPTGQHITITAQTRQGIRKNW